MTENDAMDLPATESDTDSECKFNNLYCDETFNSGNILCSRYFRIRLRAFVTSRNAKYEAIRLCKDIVKHSQWYLVKPGDDAVTCAGYLNFPWLSLLVDFGSDVELDIKRLKVFMLLNYAFTYISLSPVDLVFPLARKLVKCTDRHDIIYYSKYIDRKKMLCFI